jgi:hypothetical protein
MTNKVPGLLTELTPRQELCLLANCNAFPLDYCTRQKSEGISLNFFIVEQLPFLPPETYDKPCPWSPKTKLEKWISERVLKLTCTAEDMLPLADACDFKSGSFKKEYDGRLNKWDELQRAQLMAELDAAYFHLYGIDRDDAALHPHHLLRHHRTQPPAPPNAQHRRPHPHPLRRIRLPLKTPAVHRAVNAQLLATFVEPLITANNR